VTGRDAFSELGMFEERVDSRLPFFVFESMQHFDFDGVLMDEERILGIRVCNFSRFAGYAFSNFGDECHRRMQAIRLRPLKYCTLDNNFILGHTLPDSSTFSLCFVENWRSLSLIEVKRLTVTYQPIGSTVQWDTSYYFSTSSLTHFGASRRQAHHYRFLRIISTGCAKYVEWCCRTSMPSFRHEKNNDLELHIYIKTSASLDFSQMWCARCQRHANFNSAIGWYMYFVWKGQSGAL